MAKTLSSGKTYYGPSWLGEVYDAITNTEGWLYGEWSEEKYDVYTALHAVPVVSTYMDYLLDRRADKEYLQRYGMDYSDIHDPRKLRQSDSGSRVLRSGFNFVSDNVRFLYQ